MQRSILAHGLALISYARPGQDFDDMGALALVVIGALIIGGVCQYVAWRAFTNHWQALLVSAPCTVAVIYLFKDIFSI